MALGVGTRLGNLEILTPIGAGGMGEVYRARDTKLGREVAIKVLPDAVSRDPEKLARFGREAHLLASLNHPNIATLHGLEESDGQPFLVMELVDGETLADRLLSGPMPVDEALPLFVHIAEGLEAAHEKGIVHRDLKPANVKITRDGKPKILDFGLAKALAGEAVVQDLSQSPTLTRNATETGVLLGTAPYMSPEQARGKAVDKRTDIWAFGCCLYEALTGRAAFLGETVSDSIGKILEREPAWEALPAHTPALVRSLLRRCLRKDSASRLHDIADARIEIDESLRFPISEAIAERPTSMSNAVPWVAAAVLASLIVAIGWFWSRARPTPKPVARAELGLRPAELLGSVTPSDQRRPNLGRTAIALSPDGKALVYSAGNAEGSRLFVRSMAELQGTPLPGTDGAESPFFSPDGLWVGFWADGKLRKIRTDGSQPVTISEGIERLFGASWGKDGTIAFAQELGGLLRVSADGGAPTTLTTLSGNEVTHRLPHFLPDGDSLLYTVRERAGTSAWDEARVVVQSLRTGERKTLIENAADGRYSSTGHIVFARLGSLFAVPFDLNRLQVTGGAIEIVPDVQQAFQAGNSTMDTGAGQYTFSEFGTLIYSPGPLFQTMKRSLTWVDRQGNAAPVTIDPGRYLYPRLSPDGKKIAVCVEGLNDDVWVIDVDRNSTSRLTDEKGSDCHEIWTVDGSSITYHSETLGDPGIYEVPVDRSGPPQKLTKGDQPACWSPDGRTLVFLVEDETGNRDIWTLEPGGEPKPLVQTPFDEKWPDLSPDGRWLAFDSDRTGRDEVYVTPFPGPGPEYVVSSRGGREPAWSPTGTELFYRGALDAEGQRPTFAVAVTTTPAFHAGAPKVLFKGRFSGAVPLRDYDVSRDGQKFLVIKPTGEPSDRVTKLNVIFNWFEELKRLVPTGN